MATRKQNMTSPTPGQSADERGLSAAQQAHPQHSDAKPARGETRRLSLALQGGGSLGAFAWGVLDRLLEEEDLTFDAVSGASVGAVNAVLVAAGLLAGGKPEARRRLDHFWERSSQMAPPNPGATTPPTMVQTAVVL